MPKKSLLVVISVANHFYGMGIYLDTGTFIQESNLSAVKFVANHSLITVIYQSIRKYTLKISFEVTK